MQVTPEIVATGTALAGAVLGYAYREYRNRMRPFLQIIQTDGSTTKGDQIVAVQPEVSASLEGSFYIKTPKDQQPLRDVREHWDKADDLKQLWPVTKTDVEAILAATTAEPMCDSLSEAFEGRFFDRTLRLLLVNNRLNIPATPAEKGEVVRVFDDQKDDCVWLDFPTKAVAFGKGMTHPAVRARCEPLLALIRCLAIDELHRVFTQFKGILEAEYTAAMQTVDKLEQIIDQHSRWVLHCYIANMNNTPLIIERNSFLAVVDRKRVKYREPCYLALVKTTDEGREYIADTNTPLVVRAGSDTKFVVITRDTQGQMELGDAMRECFNRGQAKCHITVKMRKIGLLKRQTFQSQSTEFLSSSKKDWIRS
jgi:hypothetical protein